MGFFDQLKRRKAVSFEEAIRPYLAPLMRYAGRLTGGPDDAEDLVQELLLALYRKNIRLQDLDDPRSWLLKSLYNQFIDFTRKQSRNPGIPNAESFEVQMRDYSDESSRSEQLAEQADLQRQIQRALALLNPEQRALIVLHDMEGFTLNELVPVLEAPLGTLKSRLHRARDVLRKGILMEPFSESQRVTG
jgi:RNA polymerase sigma-70 factor (ECF subfamily)